MRIAFIATMRGYPWGGSELLWSQAAEILHEEGHQVLASVLGWPETPRPIVSLKQKGIIVKERRPVRLKPLSRFIKKAHRFLTGAQFQPDDWLGITNFKPDLVCISHGGTICGVSWMLKCLNAKIPYISISQSNCETNWLWDNEIDDVTRAYLGARKAYFVSENNLKLHERKMGVRLSHAEVVWNPFNVPWDTALQWPDECHGLQLACVGRLDPYDKGQDILCEIMAKPTWRNRSIVINLYGKGNCGESISRLIKMFKIEDKVFLRSHAPDVRQIWGVNHAAIFPSRAEGLPLALIEANLCERMGIVTNAGDTARPILDNSTGFIAHAPTVELFEDTMERAWHRRDEWQEIGKNARKNLVENLPKNPAKCFANKIMDDFNFSMLK